LNIEQFPLASELVKELLADYQELHESCLDEVLVTKKESIHKLFDLSAFLTFLIFLTYFQVEDSSLSKILESSVLYADMLDHSLFRPIITNLGSFFLSSEHILFLNSSSFSYEILSVMKFDAI
jgi:hypothetical protein